MSASPCSLGCAGGKYGPDSRVSSVVASGLALSPSLGGHTALVRGSWGFLSFQPEPPAASRSPRAQRRTVARRPGQGL